MNRNDSSFAKKAMTGLVLGVVGLGLLVLALGILSPAVAQTVVYGLFVATPSIPIFGAIGAVLICVGFPVEKSGISRVGSGLAALGVFTIIVMGFMVGPFVGGIAMKKDMAQDVDPEVQGIEKLPNAHENHTRVMPRAVADKKADNSMRNPRKTLGESDITYYNESYYWSKPVKPDGLVNSLTRKQDGVKLVRMNSTDSQPETVEGEFDRGLGMYWWDSAQNAYALDLMLGGSRAMDTTFVTAHEGELYNAQSYMTHEWRWAGPIPYAYPEFGGVQMLEQDGSVERLSPSEAQADARIEHDNYYPYYIAKLKLSTQAYQHGWMNTIVGHKDHLVLADVPAPENDQPFTVFAESHDHPVYVLEAEPWGDSTNGIYQVWVMNGQTGEASVYAPGDDDALIGPERAGEIVRGENSNLNWKNGDSGNIVVSEVHPVFRNGSLWYKASIVTDQQAYDFSAFINAETGEVKQYEADRQVIDFINGEPTAEEKAEIRDEAERRDAQSDTHSDWVIVITDDEGNVQKTVPLNESDSISVQSSNSTNTTAQAGA